MRTRTIAVAAALAAAMGAAGCDLPWDFSRPYPDPDAATDGPVGECTGTADCDDGIACTMDRCEDPAGAGSVCVHDFPDTDGDGYGDAGCVNAAGDSGTDCDDTRADVFPGTAALDCEGGEDRNCDGFTDLDGDGDGYVSYACGGDDCDPTDGGVHPGAAEVACDGKDNDCAGGDEGYGRMMAMDVAVSEAMAAGEIYQNAAVTSDGEIAVALVVPDGGGEMGRVAFLRMGQDGEITASTKIVDGDPGSTFQAQPSIALSDGGEFGVAWVDSRPGHEAGAIYFTLVDAVGNPLGAGIMMSDTAAVAPTDPTVLWAGAEFIVGWTESRSGRIEAYAARIDAGGVKIGADVLLSDSPGNAYSAVFAIGEAPVPFPTTVVSAAWTDDRSGSHQIHQRRATLDFSLVPASREVTDYPGNPSVPSMVWTGSEWAIAWHYNPLGPADIGLSRVDGLGNPTGGYTLVTDDPGQSYHPSIAWNGAEFGVAFEDTRSGPRRIMFVKVSAAGEKIGLEQPVSEFTIDDQRFPLVVWTGDRFAVFWHDYRGVGTEPWLYYNAMGGCS